MRGKIIRQVNRNLDSESLATPQEIGQLPTLKIRIRLPICSTLCYSSWHHFGLRLDRNQQASNVCSYVSSILSELAWACCVLTNTFHFLGATTLLFLPVCITVQEKIEQSFTRSEVGVSQFLKGSRQISEKAMLRSKVKNAKGTLHRDLSLFRLESCCFIIDQQNIGRQLFAESYRLPLAETESR